MDRGNMDPFPLVKGYALHARKDARWTLPLA